MIYWFWNEFFFPLSTSGIQPSRAPSRTRTSLRASNNRLRSWNWFYRLFYSYRKLMVSCTIWRRRELFAAEIRNAWYTHHLTFSPVVWVAYAHWNFPPLVSGWFTSQSEKVMQSEKRQDYEREVFELLRTRRKEILAYIAIDNWYRIQ